MKGAVLYPLNRLKELYPDVYTEQVKKYEGREELLDAKVSPLQCLWNDALHLTAVSPQTLRENVAKAGIELERRAWFKIPASLIQGGQSIAFTYRRNEGIVPQFKKFKNKKNYETFDPARISVYGTVPDETIAYYKEKKAEGKHPLLFHLVPHILYKGVIDTKNLEIVHL